MAAKFLKKLRAKRNRKTEPSIEKPIEAPHSTSTDATDSIAEYVDTPIVTPDEDTEKYKGSVSRDGKPVISALTADHFRPSDVASTSLKERGRGYKDTRASTVPTARNSAYAGPPRYDWVDVESSAAIKIQSIFRRNQVLNKLEEEDKTTSAMRNRERHRKAGGALQMTSEDVPGLFRFCGFGLLFSDATGEDAKELTAKRNAELEEKRQLNLAQEAMKRKFRMRKKSTVNYDEAVEVVDDVDLNVY